MKKVVIRFIPLILIVFLFLTACRDKNLEFHQVTFQDPIFRDMFEKFEYRETIYDISPILPTEEQLNRMTALNLLFPEGKECDLVDLQLFPNLRGLWISNATEHEIQQISEQNQLKALGIECMDISVDMNALGKMKNIKALVISAPVKGVADWRFVGEMEQLETLYIEHINLDDLEFLRPLKNLERLEVCDVNIGDISALKTATRLKYLLIDGDDVNDYSIILEKMDHLEQLSITDLPQMKNLDFLKTMKRLDRLNIKNIGTKSLPEWLTIENYSKLGVLGLDDEMTEVNKKKIEEMTPILKQREEQNELKIHFQDPRIYFPILLEKMKPLEVYDDE